ncbi:Isochorismate synthase entC [Kluyvera intermedia]|nr:Isochorismate synthase entC [Kluyvera intermedia]
METSVAAQTQEQQHQTLVPADSFFFMSPFRSFTTSGCFTRLTCSAEGGDAPDSAFQKELASAFAAAKAAGIENPVMVGAIPFDTRQPSALFIPERCETFSRPAKQKSSRYNASREPMKVTERQEIPEHPVFLDMVAKAATLTATPQVDKVVLSRLIDIKATQNLDSGALLERLIAQIQQALTSTSRCQTAVCCWALAPNCCCAKRVTTIALCRLRVPLAVSRTTSSIAKRVTACWHRKKTVTSTN